MDLHLIRVWVFRVLGLMLVILVIMASCSKEKTSTPVQTQTVSANQTLSQPSQSNVDYKRDLANQVADDYQSQYQIAKGNGDKARMCALAGLVATAYLNAKDDENYRLWRYYEQKDCK